MYRYQRNLPDFRSVTDHELRTLWTQHRDPDIRRLMLEVKRYRRTLDELYKIYFQVEQSWRESVGGHLVGLHELKQVLSIERGRLGGGDNG